MRYSKEEKAMWLDDWQESGKNAWAYARENGLCPQTFLTWTKISSKKKNGFVEIPKSKLAVSKQESEILIEKGDLKIHIPFEPVHAELHSVLEILGLAL